MNFISEQFTYEDSVALNGLLKAHSKRNMVVFELGTYTGRSSLSMLPQIRRMNGRLYCVDWFKGNPAAEAIINATYHEYNILDLFLRNVKEAGYDDYVTILVGNAKDTAYIVADEVADFIFIDADHRYSNVRNDILKWYPKVKSGGIICGHDFDKHMTDCDYERLQTYCEKDFVDGCHYGVIRAVCEFFPDVQWEGRVWYAQKGPYERPLLEQFLSEPRPRYSATVDASQPNAVGERNLNNSHNESDEDYLKGLFSCYDVLSGPRLIEGGYMGYNIVRYRQKYYALADALGPVDLPQTNDQTLTEYQESGDCVIAESLPEVKELLHRFAYSATSIQPSLLSWALRKVKRSIE